MEDWLLHLESLQWIAAGKILLATLLGAVIGVEREWQGRPAGLRTNIMISVASCLFTIISIEGFPLRGNTQDTARIAAQVVSGVGFLGAGTLIYSKNTVRGLTTAATVWLVAAIGMAVGAGIYFLAIFTAIWAGSLLYFLRPVSRQLKNHYSTVAVSTPKPKPNPNTPSKETKESNQPPAN